MKRTSTWLALVGLAISGCSSSSETADRNKLTAHVGKYDAPPSGLQRVKVGVPQFKVDPQASSSNFKKEELQRDAADQLTTLADLSDRFRVIERAQVDQLLKEQGLEGVVDPEELAKPGRVKGVDFLYIGKVTNMRVKAEKTSSSFDTGSFGFGGVFSVNDKKSRITMECGVDIRLVDPTTGEVLASQFGEYKRTDSIGASGVRVLGIGGDSNADLKIDDDSRGLLLRLALDDAVRKMLPKVDKRLLERQRESAKCKCGKALESGQTECADCKKPGEKKCKCGKPAADGKSECADCSKPSEGKKCCGEPLPSDAKLCPKCGTKVGD